MIKTKDQRYFKFIGRTKNNLEYQIDNKTLTKNEYYYISRIARDFLIENSISSLPICLNDILRKNNWVAISYSKLKTLNNEFCLEEMKNNLGFSLFTKDNQYYIMYDDSASIESQRFTISHEIGHIVLGHFKNLNKNREQGANMFAARILMPMCVLYECNIKSIEEIALLCNVSSISAKFRFERLQMLKKRQKFYTDKNELSLLNNFKSFIEKYIKEHKDK